MVTGQAPERWLVTSTGPRRGARFIVLSWRVGGCRVWSPIVGGWLGLVALFDKPPTHYKDTAPWSTTAANASLAAQQNAKPVDPTEPCGEPGNPYPIPPQSPWGPPSKAYAYQGNSSGD